MSSGTHGLCTPNAVERARVPFPAETGPTASDLPMRTTADHTDFGTRDAIYQQALAVQVPAQEIPPDGKRALLP